MSIEVIVSTINNELNSLDCSLTEYNNITVINQTPNLLNNKMEESIVNGIKWIDIDQRGLSKSRNYAINISTSEYIYLADDDIILNSKFNLIVKEAFKKYPQADIIAFQVNGIDKEFKNYPLKEFKINYRNSMKISSVQLVMKASFIKKKNLKYDELFGTGSRYAMGEENIFLLDALKKNAKIIYIPEEISKVHIGDSSWFKGFTEEYFFNRGASYWRMFGIFSPVVVLLFCWRKRELFENNISFAEAFISSLKGIKDYVTYSKKNEDEKIKINQKRE